MARSKKLAIGEIKNGSSTKPDKRNCSNPEDTQYCNGNSMQRDEKIARRVLVGDRGAREKNLETKKGKRRVDLKADAKKRQIGANE